MSYNKITIEEHDLGRLSIPSTLEWSDKTFFVQFKEKTKPLIYHIAITNSSVISTSFLKKVLSNKFNFL